MTTAPPEILRAAANAARGKAQVATNGCTRPVRLQGEKGLVNTTTGELTTLYASRQELDGQTYVRCGNRRESECEPCSREYKGDAWHLLVAGLAGGKGIPAEVSERPATFLTLTAPSFGAVHGQRAKGPCRARRDKPVCPHGRPMWCNRRHFPGDPMTGEALCPDCYDYLGHVLWQWHVPELWRRFVIRLQRLLAAAGGVPATEFNNHAKVSYSKVAEFQVRGVVHFHVPMRLDGPAGPDGGPTALPIDIVALEHAATTAAAEVWADSAPLRDGTVVRLRWGSQVDLRTISSDAPRDADRAGRRAHPEQVASYLAKYLTKATAEFGLPTRVRSGIHARSCGAPPQAVRLVETCMRIASEGGSYERLALYYATLGYRGHPITKSRAYSVTFGQLRRARRVFHRQPGLDPNADIRELLDEEVPDGFELISTWAYVGRGYLELDQAERAVASAAFSRTRHRTATSPTQSAHGLKEGKEDA